MSPLFFLSLAPDLCRPFPRLSLASLPPTFSFSLCFSSAVFQICGHDNQSKLNTLDNTDTETISTFRFRLYWLFSCDTGGYAISRQNNLELHLGCHTCWLSYFTLVCLWCGRTVGRCTVTWLPNFLGWVDLLTHGAPLASARDLLYDAPYYIL